VNYAWAGGLTQTCLPAGRLKQRKQTAKIAKMRGEKRFFLICAISETRLLNREPPEGGLLRNREP
jgi:hypothetical protein